MGPEFLYRATTLGEGTPLGAAGRGIAGGLAGALLLSVVSRVLPGLRARRIMIPLGPREESPVPTPAQALTLAQSPGPEGLAEQFAFKVAAGIFGQDIGPHVRLAGRLVHLAYGAAWGLLYGLLQATYRRSPAAFGTVYGLVVWLVGPAFLVPAMRLMGRPSEEPTGRSAALIAGHLAYGVALATAFEALHAQRQTR
jgi:uncharacterized membrane protein YagU involved in acid resistance